MTRSVLLAGAAGATAVLAAWELVALAAGAAASGALDRLLGPWRRAGTAGAEPTVRERRRLAAVTGLTLLAAGWLLAGPLVAAVMAAAAPALLAAALRARRRRWRARLAEGAPDVARALADALAGGHSIRGALAEAAAGGGVGGPAGRELRLVAAALALGEPTVPALERLRARAAAPAYDTLVAAVLLQQDAGGDLAGLLRELATSLEAAGRAARDARTATAQARFTGTLVAVLPIGAAALAELAQPGALAGLAGTPLTATMLAAAAVLQVTGLLAIRRLSRGPR